MALLGEERWCPQLAQLSPSRASSDGSQLQASGAPASCRVCAARSQPETEVVLRIWGGGEFCPLFLGAGPARDQGTRLGGAQD